MMLSNPTHSTQSPTPKPCPLGEGRGGALRPYNRPDQPCDHNVDSAQKKHNLKQAREYTVYSPYVRILPISKQLKKNVLSYCVRCMELHAKKK